MRDLRFWRWRKAQDDDVDREFEVHLALEIDEQLGRGVPLRDAKLAAHREFGSIALAKEELRDMRTGSALDRLWQDVRYALRLMRRSPGHTLAVVAALGIGIGANTAVFSIVNGVLLKAFAYKDLQQLVLLFEQLPNAPNKFGFSPPDFEIVRQATQSYSGLAGYRTLGYELSDAATPLRVIGARISPELFSVLGVAPALGRAITPDDDRQNALVAVVGHGLWSRAFGRDPSLVGRTISLDGRPHTVVGIMPQRFEFPPRGAEINGEPADVFVPMAFLPFERQAFGMLYNNTVIARLKPGVSIEQARAEASSLRSLITERYPPVLRDFASTQSIPIAPLYEETVGRSRRLLLVLMGAVGLVLLITCADVATLILTRSASRQRELAIRSALGATGGRLVRQLLTEAFVLAAAGGALGLALAYGAMRALLSLAGETLPRADSIAFDYRILAFAMVLAVVTPLVFGVVPAFRATRATDAEALKEGTRGATPGRRRARLLGFLVVGQFAVALVLSVGAGLLVRSFVRLVQTDPGFRPEQVVGATVTLPAGRYPTPPQVVAFYRRTIEASRTIPGLAFIGAGNDLPLNVRERRAVTGDASARLTPEMSRLIAPTWTAGRYFETLGIPLKRGRFFADADGPTAQRVVIVNEQLARLLWPEADPVGRQIKWGIAASQSPWMTIVGVVGDVKQAGLDTPAMAQAYIPVAQDNTGGPLLRTVNLVVRSSRDAESLMTDVRGAVQRLDPALPTKMVTLENMVGESMKPQRFSMTVMVLFAGLALMLAAIGICGVLANAVTQQTHEIGIRVALGATSGDIMWMVLGRAFVLMGTGLVIGTIGALALTRTMAGLLFEVRATDAVSFFGATAALAAVALVAGVAPAWRATRVDPMVALRAE